MKFSTSDSFPLIVSHISPLVCLFTFIVCFLLFPVQLGKSVVASKDIPAGTELTYDLLTVKVAEPKGYQPEIMSDLIGKRTKKALAYDDSVRGEDVVME